MAGIDVRQLGDFIREQRDLNNISLRQLARLAGVSNPYLSQIERGLRKPSAEILQQIAKALRISAEALYVQAGILEQREGSGLVPDAILADEGLSERQKQVLLEIYDSFRKENAAAAPATPADDGEVAAVSVVTASGLPDGLSTAVDGRPSPAAATTEPATATEPSAPAKRPRARRTTAKATAGTRPRTPRARRSTPPPSTGATDAG